MAESASSTSRLSWVWALSGLCALVPPFVMWRFVVTHHTEAFSNDYLLWVPLVDRMLSGSYPWADYFRDSFQAGSHCFAVPILLTLAIAQLSSWSIAVTLQICLIIATIKTLLLFDVLTLGASAPRRMISLPVTSAIVFTTAHVNDFTFGFAATHLGLTELGLALAVWGIARFRGRWLGLVSTCVGALIASWSWGSGVMVWPIVGAALLPQGFGKRRHLAFFALIMAICAMPYIRYGDMTVSVANSGLPGKTPLPWLFLEGIGWEWSGGFAPLRARFAGGVALLLLAGAIATFRKRRSSVSALELLPAAMFIVFGFSVITLAVFVRTHLAPWYASSFGYLWIGLLGLAVRSTGEERDWGLAASLITAVLYVLNGGFENKVYYLRAQGPAAESCLRHYREYATWPCEFALFQWPPGHAENIGGMAEPLDRNGWGPFAGHQLWSLQGEWLFSSVSFDHVPGVPDPSWSTTEEPERPILTEYRPLNLLLSSSSALQWRPTLPRLETVVFRGAVKLAEKSQAPTASVTISVDGAVRFTQSLNADRWTPIEIPLTHASHTRPVITLAASAPSGSALVLFREARLELEVSPRLVGPEQEQPEPDLVLDMKKWTSVRLGRAGETKWLIVQPDPALIYNAPLDLCVDDFSAVVLRMGSTMLPYYRHVQLYYRLATDPGFSEAHSLRLPVLPGPPRSHTVLLRLLNIPAGARLTGLRLDPLDGPSATGIAAVDLADLRFSRRDGPSRCQ